MQRILEVRVIASLDAGDHATQRARFAAGYDSSWRDWLERFERGEAVVARLTTTVRFVAEGRNGEVEVVNDGVWLEVDHHLPKVQEQIREVAYKDTRELEARLWREGVHVAAADLENMFLEVRLAEDLEHFLLGGPRPSPPTAASEAFGAATGRSPDAPSTEAAGRTPMSDATGMHCR